MRTCQTEGGHSLKLGFLEPLPHSAKCLPARFQFGPWLGIPEKVGQRALRPAQHSLREYRLRYAVAFQFSADPLCQLLGVDLFQVRTTAVRSSS